MAELVVRCKRTGLNQTAYDWQKRHLPIRDVSSDYKPPAGFDESKASLEERSTYLLATALQLNEEIADFHCDHEGLTLCRAGAKVKWHSIDEFVENLLRSLRVPDIKKIRLVDYQLVNWK